MCKLLFSQLILLHSHFFQNLISSSNQSPGDPLFPFVPFVPPVIPSSNLVLSLIIWEEITVLETTPKDFQLLIALH